MMKNKKVFEFWYKLKHKRIYLRKSNTVSSVHPFFFLISLHLYYYYSSLYKTRVFVYIFSLVGLFLFYFILFSFIKYHVKAIIVKWCRLFSFFLYYIITSCFCTRLISVMRETMMDKILHKISLCSFIATIAWENFIFQDLKANTIYERGYFCEIYVDPALDLKN